LTTLSDGVATFLPERHPSGDATLARRINAAETGGRRLMFARIAVMRALNGEK